MQDQELFNIVLEVLVIATREENEIREIQTSKEVNLSLFSDDMILYRLLLLLSRFSGVQLCATLWTVACQAPLSKEFSRQEYWSGLPCPPRYYTNTILKTPPEDYEILSMNLIKL